MRGFWAAAAICLAFAASAGSARAEIQGPGLLPADETSALRDALLPAIRADLEQRTAAATDPAEKNWLSELAGYYATPGRAPLWVDRDGLLAGGLAAIEEIRRADDYGLDPAQFDVPGPVSAGPLPAELAAAEVKLSLAAAQYAWHARGGRVDPSKLSLWLDQRPRIVYASEVLRLIEVAGAPVPVLLSFHPRHPQFDALRKAYLAERGGVDRAPVATLSVPGPRLVRGDRHPDIPLIRKRLDVPAGTADRSDLLDGELLGAVRTFMYEGGYGRKRAVDDEVRAALNRPAARSLGDRKPLLQKFLVNLERWRWMPEDMGALHIWNNLPEFETRVVKGGDVIHQERIVIGTASTQTPVFSGTMRYVIFQPDWGVPYWIKVRSILPHLRGGDYGVLERRNMRIWDGEQQMRPGRFNWSKADIASIPIVQGPGPDNPLGRLKFMFPNAHDVYMHDTPSKDLFETRVRTHSHGCIRVRNPQRLAEVVLGETEGWTPANVKSQLQIKTTRQVDLTRAIPVHNTYFTLVAGPSGALTNLTDVYGHDRRISDALAGKSVQLIAASDPALVQQRENRELVKASGGDFRPQRAKSAGRASAPRRVAAYVKFSQPMYLRPSPVKPAKFKFFLFQ